MTTLVSRLESYSLAQAEAEASGEHWEAAHQWLEKVPPQVRPAELARAVLEGLAREHLAQRRWAVAVEFLEQRLRLGEDHLLRMRLVALRARKPLMPDHQWMLLASKVAPAQRLPMDCLPGLDGVWAAGAYYSRGTHRGAPWSRLLRASKSPAAVEDGWQMLRLACDYASRFLSECTPLLGLTDCVVAIPARPARYAERLMTLPDEVGKSLAEHLGLPYLPFGLVSTRDDLEMKKLSHAERRRAIRDSMRAENRKLIAGRNVLVVDDLTTTGSTLQEAARQLRSVGVSRVFGFALAHTEG